ncbi:acyl-CoA synthetase [Pseudoluteimonas lycopersici]|uniref:Acyl-CoA synthetase n=2 Tax=Pseudoluteimonas lycopersici TaxID=1324796 RepID=A0A516V8H3_9GAMM|nr:acyl-CoA synthetase [Lysobacter lycopersici]
MAIAIGPVDRALAFGPRGATPLSAFLGEARALAAQLDAGEFVVNLCEDRHRFLTGFCAAALRGKATLLPPSRAPEVVADVQRRHPSNQVLDDATVAAVIANAPLGTDAIPEVAADALAAIGFTSGSTGVPQANPKTWGAFATSTAQNLAALRDLWPADAQAQIVATVPPQHMYGMELSVLMPLLGGAAVHEARPFFPADIARALADATAMRVLVTTPVHLRALVASGIELPPLAGIVSATAPLPAELAMEAESRFDCEVRELFGSTETCVFARRRTARESAWTPLPGVRVAALEDATEVRAAHLPKPVLLADRVEVDGEGRFELRGRQADLLEIAGKRASLGDLTRRLLEIPGVEDGCVFQLDAASGEVARVAALVVAPTRDEAGILDALRAGVDPAFLPRPLRKVAALPRNETGKLPRAELLAMLRRCG